MIDKYIRKDLQGFLPYHAPLKDYEIKLDANENPYPHCNEVLEAARKWIDNKDNFTRYPDTDQNNLRETLGNYYKVAKENIICGVGSDQLIEYILKLFIEPNDIILVPNPSFSMYELSNTINHGKTIRYELDDEFEYSYEQIIELYKEHCPKIIFICTPNNPTGTVIKRDSLLALLEEVECPVVLDEAYAEFVEKDFMDLVEKFENLIILKTFSKAFGLAGLRVGYGISSKKMIESINICKAPYNLSAFSADIAESVIKNANYYNDVVFKLNQNREHLISQLANITVIERVFPSEANFVLVRVKNIDVCKYLEEFKILVRGYGDKGRLANCIRISVGTEQENQRIINVLHTFNQ